MILHHGREPQRVHSSPAFVKPIEDTLVDSLAPLQAPRSPATETYRSRLMLSYRIHIDGTREVCAAAHCPFIASPAARFFGSESFEDVAAIAGLDAILTHPRMSTWNAPRDEDFAAYIALVGGKTS